MNTSDIDSLINYFAQIQQKNASTAQGRRYISYFTKDEDEIIMQKIKQNSYSWKEFVVLLRKHGYQKTAPQISQHWRRVLRLKSQSIPLQNESVK